MKKIILLTIAMFMFTGCLTSSLTLDESNDLILKYNNDSVLLANKILEKSSLNYKDLFVDIYKLKNDKNRVLFYEKAQTTLEFEFNFGALYSVMYIFDYSRKYTDIYKRNNLRFVQLQLKNGTAVNVLIQASDTQFITYVYGFSNEEFMEIANSVRDSDDELGTLEHNGIVFNDNSKHFSTWTDKMVYFAPLITPARYLGGR